MSTGLKKNTGGGLPANPSELLGALENVNRSIKSSGGLPFLRLLTDGEFVFGQDNTEVEEGSLWAANPYTVQHGYACWDSDKSVLLDEIMLPMTEPKPLLSSLPDLGHDWKPQTSVQLQCLNGEDEGVVVLYKGTSKGLNDAIKALTGEIIAQIKSGEEAFVPVVTLESSHYTHKKHGRTYFPVIGVDHWVDMEGIAAEGEQPEEPEDEELPDDEYTDEDYDGIEDGELVEDEEEPEPEPEKPAPKKRAAKKAPVKAAAGKAPAKKAATAKKDPAPSTRRRRRASS